MTTRKPTPLDNELISRTRYEKDPSSCIVRQTVDSAAALLRSIPGYRQALGETQEIAVPEMRSGLLRRTVTPAVMGWLALEMRWDVSLYAHGCYSSLRAFLVDSGELLCVVNARDRSFMYSAAMSVEEFVRLFMTAWISKDSSATYYDAAAMNHALDELFERVFNEHCVPKSPLADGALCKELMRLLGR